MTSPIEWVRRLENRITRQKTYAKPYEDRYRNKVILPWLVSEYREVYGASADQVLKLRPPMVGAAAISVEALVERLTVAGAEGDDDAVRVVDEAWESLDLDVMHREAHREALIKARSFAQVLPSDDGRAVVGIETPEQMAIARQQGPPYDVIAALKVWNDEWDGSPRGTLHLPGRRFELDKTGPATDPATSWRIAGETESLAWVPVVEFRHRPRLLAQPESEIERIETLVDLADLADGLMVFAGHFGAVPIRWATGLPLPRDPKNPDKVLLGPDGKPAIGFNPRSDGLWVSSDKDTEFGQLVPATLDPYVSWAEHISRRLRAKTSIPATYYGIEPKSHMSAELLKVDEAPMVRRVWAMGRDGSFGQAWRRLMTWIVDIERPDAGKVRPRWVDPETRVEAQATDSFVKLVASGIGVRVAARQTLGWSPDDIEEGAAEGERARAQQAATGLGGDVAALLDGLPHEMGADELAKRANAAGTLIRAGFDPEEALRTSGLDPIRHSNLVPITVRPADAL